MLRQMMEIHALEDNIADPLSKAVLKTLKIRQRKSHGLLKISKRYLQRKM